MKKFSILLLVIAIASCTASKMIVPTQADADKAQRDFPSASLAELNSGKSLYEQHCNSCHGLKNLADYSVEAWHNIVPGMVQQCNEKTPNSVSESDERLILMYVTSVGH
jgi:cytochrome c1